MDKKSKELVAKKLVKMAKDLTALDDWVESDNRDINHMLSKIYKMSQEAYKNKRPDASRMLKQGYSKDEINDAKKRFPEKEFRTLLQDLKSLKDLVDKTYEGLGDYTQDY